MLFAINLKTYKMNLNQYTVKSQEAIQKAQQIAMEFGNQQIEPQHLLEGIFQIEESVSEFLLKKSEAELNLVRERNREAIEKLPKVEGGNIYLSQSANKVLLDAPNVAKKMDDEFVTIEHLWLSLLDVNSDVSKILKDMGITKKGLEMAIKELRKGSKATSASSEETYQSLNKYAKNFNELAAAGKLDPVIGRDDNMEMSDEFKAIPNLESMVTLIIDDDEYTFHLNSKKNNILDQALQDKLPVPFACKGGVCCTCKAQVLEGEVFMEKNFALTEDEVERGFVLTCQCHPTTNVVMLTYDV
jgi:ferredoxin